MYINLREKPKDIKFGDIISYEGEACLIIDAIGFKPDYPVLVVNLSRSKVMNSYANLEALSDCEYELMAEESKVQIGFIKNTEGY